MIELKQRNKKLDSFILSRLILLYLLANQFIFLQGQYSEHLYGVESGLSHHTVMDIEQDGDGFIWVHTEFGLCRFDGFRFKEYNANINNQEVRIRYGRFLKDSQNRIWLESATHALLILDHAYDKTQTAFPMRGHNIYGILDDSPGNFYLYGGGKFLKVKEEGRLKFSVNNLGLEEPLFMLNCIFQFNDRNLLGICLNGIFELEVKEDSVLGRKVNLSGDPDLIERINEDARFIVIDEVLCIKTGNAILKTNLDPEKWEHDTEITLTRLHLDFPEVGLKDDQAIYAMVKGRDHEWFIRSEGGIFLYNSQQKSAVKIRDEKYGDMDEFTAHFRSALLYTDDRVLWAGTDDGLLKIVIGNKPFQSILPDSTRKDGLQTGKVQSVLVDSEEKLWVGTKSEGLYCAEKEEDGSYRSFTNYKPKENDPYALRASFIRTLFEDSKKRIWVGTSDLQWMDPNEPGVFHSTQASQYADQLLTTLSPNGIQESPGGNIISVAFQQGLCWLIKGDLSQSYLLVKDSMLTIFRNPGFGITKDKKLFIISGNNLYRMKPEWIFSEHSSGLRLGDPGYDEAVANKTLMPWAAFKEHELLFSLDSLQVEGSGFIITENEFGRHIWMYMHRLNKIWRINLDTLLADYETGNKDFKLHYVSLPVEEDQFLGKLYDIIEDQRGSVWCKTDQGLIRIDPASLQCQYYHRDDGLPSELFQWGSYIDRDGRVFMCTTNGLVYFHPDSIFPDLTKEPVLTDFHLFHRKIQPDSIGILQGAISKIPGLELNHRQNFLGFGFSCLDYRNTEHIRFNYMLEGLDEEWLNADEDRFVEYTSLRPGKYTFKVMVYNGNGIKSEKIASLPVRILPPLWFRWWAIVLETLLFLSLLTYFIRYRERELRQQTARLEIMVDEKTHEILEQRKEVDALKSRFYTNISHEFRTPLTLILGPLEDAMKKGGTNESLSEGIIKIMMNNARRLQRLINQLLDISKIESGKMEIRLVKGDLGQYLRAIASSFLSLAESQKVEFTIQTNLPTGEFCFDADKLEKVISNLLSNAFKFTPSGGKVEIGYFLNTKERDPVLEMKIRDTGKGIDAKQAEKIFDRFYQVADQDSREAEGSGIGLALTKELIHLMNGSIRLESQKGEGTSFYICIPVLESRNVQEEIPLLDKDVYMIDHEEDLKEEKELKERKIQHAESDEIILIVEDNADLRQYVKHRISGGYKLLEANNGKQGLDLALLHIPDLILTDIMMPEMDGTELCRKLKSNPLTDHIPVIMLTAKADKESMLGGLEIRADDYITKPFDSEILNARIQNLLEQRNALRESILRDFLNENPPKNKTQHQKGFLDEFFAIIETQMDDPELKVDEVARKMNMSRAQLFRKSQSIAASTPHELIRMFRIKEAASLLKQGTMDVTQVMYQVGMKNLSHFAKVFRTFYGVNPSEYSSKNRN